MNRWLYSIYRNQHGASIIEFAAILPVAVLLAILVAEYGWYFMQKLDADRQVSIAAQRIQEDPRTAVQPTFSGGFFQGALCAQVGGGGCSSGWSIDPGRGVFVYDVSVQAQDQFNSLTGIYDALLPDVVSARETVAFDAGECSYRQYMEHPGCTLTIFEPIYRCNGAASGTYASSTGFQEWGDWFLPTCVSPQNVLRCEWDRYPGTLDAPCGPDDTACEMTLDPGPHMCSTAHPPCPPCSSGGGGGSNGGDWGVDTDRDGTNDRGPDAGAPADSSSAGGPARGAYGGGGGNGGGGGCFLTTAVIRRREEEDDGPTLTKLRRFRDTYMMANSERRAMLEEYYRIAPLIVAAIPEDHNDWEWIAQQVDLAVAAIDEADNDQAFEIYASMVAVLKETWL